ncbi:hypothetical protein L484_007747 [Morus notabilis]|uniref:DUF3511 domain-containing protein n=1 Tax=Morus notabilis TaxID=981085 RepID=W9RIC7_9ROSA|nr:hypothetical protein L484_007747 [Morus notabilis]
MDVFRSSTRRNCEKIMAYQIGSNYRNGDQHDRHHNCYVPAANYNSCSCRSIQTRAVSSSPGFPYPNSLWRGPSSSKEKELKRQRRVARYKAYGVESKLKAKIRKGFRWFKQKCSALIHG